MVTWQVGPLQVEQSLPHAPKMKPEAGVGVAVRVVVEPVANESEQVPPCDVQLIAPGLLVIVPVPTPVGPTASGAVAEAV
jgi:hypothetical protein